MVAKICKDIGWTQDLQTLIDLAPKIEQKQEPAPEEKKEEGVDQLASDLDAL